MPYLVLYPRNLPQLDRSPKMHAAISYPPLRNACVGRTSLWVLNSVLRLHQCYEAVIHVSSVRQLFAVHISQPAK